MRYHSPQASGTGEWSIPCCETIATPSSGSKPAAYVVAISTSITATVFSEDRFFGSDTRRSANLSSWGVAHEMVDARTDGALKIVFVP